MLSTPSYICTLLIFLSQVLGGGAAEEGAWPESPNVGGHLQVSLVENVAAGSTDVPGGNALIECSQQGNRVSLFPALEI